MRGSCEKKRVLRAPKDHINAKILETMNSGTLWSWALKQNVGSLCLCGLLGP